MKKSSKINWLKLLMVLPLTAMLLVLVSMKTLPEPRFLADYIPTNLSLIKQQLLAAHDSIEVTTKVKRIKSPVHYEYISELNNGKITAQFGDLQYEIGEISNNEEYRQVLEMLRIFKSNSSFKKTYEEELVAKPDKMPLPEGGMETWNKFLSQNLKMPAQARELGVEGVVYAQFIVGKEGKITSPTILKSLGMGLDDEVLRILNLSTVPKWAPGEKAGELVSTLMTIPVKFKTDHTPESSQLFPGTHNVREPKFYKGEMVYDVVEQMPVPPGGMEGWNKYIAENLKYPKTAKEAKIEGTVYLVFIVDKEGNIANPEILRGIGGGADEEAIRLVKNSPKWTPASQRGEVLNVQMRLPIRFQLTSDAEAYSFPDNVLNEIVVNSYGSSKHSDPRFLPAKKKE